MLQRIFLSFTSLSPSVFLMVCTILTLHSSCKWQVVETQDENKKASRSEIKIIRNFKAIGTAPDYDTTLVSQYIRSIFEDAEGNLWFGTLGEGVVRYDGITLTYFSKPEGFLAQSVHAITEDHQGNLWFGTEMGIYKHDGKTFKLYHQEHGLSSIQISRRSLVVDKTGSLWVGTGSGVFRYDSIADKNNQPCFQLFSILPIIQVADMMFDRDGVLWIASTDQGIYRYDKQGWKQFNDKVGMGVNYAGGIAQDKSGNMWFTIKSGICVFDGKNFVEYTANDGLGGTEFWGLWIEDSGIIWITARGSTTRFNPKVPKSDPNAFTVFTPEDGINCCVQSMYQDKSGRMLFGTGQGLYLFEGHRFYKVKQQGPWE